jgi:ubiquinone/menaquinone biosynthesis C-methylase UbiE
MAKDLFSSQASLYAKYRPTYPAELYDYILGFVQERNSAWDCATGNGQAAGALAGYFQRVEATDSSEAQLKNAVQKENIHYRISPAEKTPFANNSFDLITVATAYHWLNRKAFHDEATRVGKPGCVVAVWAYNIVRCEVEAINQVIQHFYHEVIYSFWDRERRLVELSYQTVEFDFSLLPSKEFFIHRQWKKEELVGYISSWSSVQNYQQQVGESPLSLLQNELEKAWPDDGPKAFSFPLFLKIGRITK